MRQMKAEAGITITAEALRDIEEEAGRAFPAEACGILLAEAGEQRICGLRALGNRIKGEEAERFFEIDPLKLYRAEQEAEKGQRKIIGFFHSHTEAEAVLSETDESYMIPGMLYLILSLKERGSGRLRAYLKSDPGSPAREVPVETAAAQI